jgi:hypothetical protein
MAAMAQEGAVATLVEGEECELEETDCSTLQEKTRTDENSTPKAGGPELQEPEGPAGMEEAGGEDSLGNLEQELERAANFGQGPGILADGITAIEAACTEQESQQLKLMYDEGDVEGVRKFLEVAYGRNQIGLLWLKTFKIDQSHVDTIPGAILQEFMDRMSKREVGRATAEGETPRVVFGGGMGRLAVALGACRQMGQQERLWMTIPVIYVAEGGGVPDPIRYISTWHQGELYTVEEDSSDGLQVYKRYSWIYNTAGYGREEISEFLRAAWQRQFPKQERLKLRLTVETLKQRVEGRPVRLVEVRTNTQTQFLMLERAIGNFAPLMRLSGELVAPMLGGRDSALEHTERWILKEAAEERNGQKLVIYYNDFAKERVNVDKWAMLGQILRMNGPRPRAIIPQSNRATVTTKTIDDARALRSIFCGFSGAEGTHGMRAEWATGCEPKMAAFQKAAGAPAGRGGRGKGKGGGLDGKGRTPFSPEGWGAEAEEDDPWLSGGQLDCPKEAWADRMDFSPPHAGGSSGAEAARAQGHTGGATAVAGAGGGSPGGLRVKTSGGALARGGWKGGGPPGCSGLPAQREKGLRPRAVFPGPQLVRAVEAPELGAGAGDVTEIQRQLDEMRAQMQTHQAAVEQREQGRQAEMMALQATIAQTQQAHQAAAEQREQVRQAEMEALQATIAQTQQEQRQQGAEIRHATEAMEESRVNMEETSRNQFETITRMLTQLGARQESEHPATAGETGEGPGFLGRLGRGIATRIMSPGGKSSGERSRSRSPETEEGGRAVEEVEGDEDAP